MELSKLVTIQLIIVTNTDSSSLEVWNVEYKLTTDLYLYTECFCLGLMVLIMFAARQNTHKFRTVTLFLIFITHKEIINYLYIQ
jgi:hypothetical protein